MDAIIEAGLGKNNLAQAQKLLRRLAGALRAEDDRMARRAAGDDGSQT